MVPLTEGSLQQQHLRPAGGSLLEWNIFRPHVGSAKSETVVGVGSWGSELGLNEPYGVLITCTSSLRSAGMDGSQSPHSWRSPMPSLQGSPGPPQVKGRQEQLTVETTGGLGEKQVCWIRIPSLTGQPTQVTQGRLLLAAFPPQEAWTVMYGRQHVPG